MPEKEPKFSEVEPVQEEKGKDEKVQQKTKEETVDLVTKLMNEAIAKIAKIDESKKEAERTEKAKKEIDKEKENGNKIRQESIEITEEELKRLIEQKAEYVYENNIVVRFTNAAFLGDIFETKKEFKDNAMLMMQRDDYRNYWNERVQEYRNLPEKGKATLGSLVDRVYEGEISAKKDITKCSDIEKNADWHQFVDDWTDWRGTGGRKYIQEIAHIKKIKREATDRDDFVKKMRDYAINSIKRYFLIKVSKTL